MNRFTKTGKTQNYIVSEGGSYVAKDACVIRPNQVDKEQSGFLLRHGPMREIAAAVGSTTDIYMSDCYIEYPDQSSSSTIFMSDIIIEYKPSAGIRRTKGKETKFDSVYLGTFCTVGIPAKTFALLEKSMVDSRYQGSYSGDGFIPSGDYRWGIAKILSDGEGMPSVMVSIMNGNEPNLLGDILGVATGAKKSFMATCSFTVRLKRVNPSQRSSGYRAIMDSSPETSIQDNKMVHELGFTLTDVIFQQFTTLSSPQITSNVKSRNIKVAYKEEDAKELIDILNQIKLEEDQDQVQE